MAAASREAQGESESQPGLVRLELPSHSEAVMANVSVWLFLLMIVFLRQCAGLIFLKGFTCISMFNPVLEIGELQEVQ